MVKKNDNEETLVVKAIGKSLKSSPQKTNLVLGLIRGLKVEKAINNLIFSKRRISGEVLKILKSAISNAENNHQLDIDKLFVICFLTRLNNTLVFGIIVSRNFL